MGWLQRRLLTISPAETAFSRRGFRAPSPAAREHLESVGQTFLTGYHAALDESAAGPLERRLERTPQHLRGFAYEGAAMGLMLQDLLFPGRRFQGFLKGPGDRHAYMVHVGAGWAIARLPVYRTRVLERLDPLLRWLALDGEGFHEGYFHARTRIREKRPRRGLSGYQTRAFDHGLGRSLWFVEGTDVESITATILTFPKQRRSDLWAGVGLGAAYAGGGDSASLATLVEGVGEDWPCLAQGAAFAAKARARAGNPTPHTDHACLVLSGLTSTQAAKLTDEALAAIPSALAADLPSYELWRREIQARFISGSTERDESKGVAASFTRAAEVAESRP